MKNYSNIPLHVHVIDMVVYKSLSPCSLDLDCVPPVEYKTLLVFPSLDGRSRSISLVYISSKHKHESNTVILQYIYIILLLVIIYSM